MKTISSVTAFLETATHNRTEYDRAFALVGALIREWDPYSLLRGGAPVDEWDREIALVVAELPRIRSYHDAADQVSRVFSATFQPEAFGQSDCLEVGRRLYSALCSAGWMTQENGPGPTQT